MSDMFAYNSLPFRYLDTLRQMPVRAVGHDLTHRWFLIERYLKNDRAFVCADHGLDCFDRVFVTESQRPPTPSR
jgi:hypothetical protein